MNEQRYEKRAERLKTRLERRSHDGRKWIGIFLLIVGGLFLARASGADFPRWLFTWPMLLIGFGILSGIKHNFRGIGWLFPIFVGGFFLIDQLSPELRIKPYIWPAALVALGLVFLLRPKKKHWADEITNSNSTNIAPTVMEPAAASTGPSCMQATNDSSDVIDATAIFGGFKKNIISKNFRGGEVTTFMGGAEINLTKADWNGTIMIDCFNMFGGTKLIVPPDWDVQSDIVTIFGGLEDKRPPATVNPDKILYLDGTCIFGGVEIKSF